MLAVQACYGVKLTSHGNKSLQDVYKVDVFAKMSNKYLGKMVLPSNVQDSCLFDCLFGVIRDLQRQAAKLFPHHERPFKYLKLFVNQEELPSLAYLTKDDVIPCVARAVKALQEATHESRIDLMWDEDDTFAFDKICDYLSVKDGMLIVNIPQDLFNYVGVLEFTHHPTRLALQLQVYGSSTNRINVDFLANMKQLCELHLHNLSPISWDFMKHLSIKKLSLVDVVDVDVDALQAFSRVEHLELFCFQDMCFLKSLEHLACLKSLNITVIEHYGKNRAALDAWASNLIFEEFQIQTSRSTYTWELCAFRT